MDRNTVLQAANSWLGCRESDGTHRVIIDTYNTITPLPAGYRMTYTDFWCAAFVSAVAQKVGATDIIYPECSCPRMITLFQQHNRWMEDDSYTPKPGDIIFYDWQDSGIGDNIGVADHVGIVYSVVGTNITLIEGNCNNSVAFTNVQVNGRYIRGYGLPKYDDAVTSVPAAPSITVPNTNIQVGSKVKVIGNTWYTGGFIPDFVKNDTWIVLAINGDRVVIDKNASGTNSIMSPINIKDIVLAEGSTTTDVSNIIPDVPVGNTTIMTEKQIWDYLMSVYNNPYGVAAIMGNLYAESALQANNMQNSYEAALGYNDKTYTESVDNGTYTNFVNDAVGYGLVQWTYWSRKKALYNYAKSNNRSIGDPKMQLEFMVSEMAGYQGLVDTIKNAKNVRTASDFILVNYERPANQSEAVKIARSNMGETFLKKYGNVTPSTTPTPATPVTPKDPKVGDVVNFKGNTHYTSSSIVGIGFRCRPGKATITAINSRGKHPYHLVKVPGQGSTVYGWVDSGTFE